MRKSRTYICGCVLIAMLTVPRARPDTQTISDVMREPARAEHSLDDAREFALKAGRRGGASQKEVACEEALKNAPKVKAGMKKQEVLNLLGPPTGRSGERWGYNFLSCVRPPRAGEQLIIGMEIFFGAGAVREIKWATVDATGPGSAAMPDAALESFWNKFQSAVAVNDKEAVASMTKLPLSMPFGTRSIRTRAQLMKSYEKIFDAATRKCFATARPLTKSAASRKFSINCGAAMMYWFELVRGAYKFTAVDNFNE